MKKKIRLTEGDKRKIVTETVSRVLRTLREQSARRATYEDWRRWLRGHMPLTEFYNAETDDYYTVYMDFDEQTQTLNTGDVTNVGFHASDPWSVEVYDGNFQAAYEELYDIICTDMYADGYEPC